MLQVLHDLHVHMIVLLYLTFSALTVATNSLAGSVTSVFPAGTPSADWLSPAAAAAAAAAVLQAYPPTTPMYYSLKGFLQQATTPVEWVMDRHERLLQA